LTNAKCIGRKRISSNSSADISCKSRDFSHTKDKLNDNKKSEKKLVKKTTDISKKKKKGK